MKRRALVFFFVSGIVFSTSSGWALEKCKLSAKRVAYPPGTQIIKVDAGPGTIVQKFSESRPLLDYLKQINGKKCDVDWVQAKQMMNERLATWAGIDSSVANELDALITQQENSQKVQEAQKEVAKAAQSKKAGSGEKSITATPQNSCDARLAEVKKRISELSSDIYNSQEKRVIEIAEILKILNGTH